MDTLVLETCASACTELFVSGRRRFVGPKARFMFHQSGYEGRPKNAVWDIPEYESSILLRAQGVAQNFADAALNEPNHGAWWPHVVDVKRSGFATHWWSDRPAEYN
jgi:ATP-dependent protease ClpP protease subunit